MKLALSILQIKEEQKLKQLDDLEIDYIHLDIMDGLFVPNKTNTTSNILKDLNTKIDVHLMVNDIKSYVDEYSMLNPEFITFHYEATNNPIDIINYIKNKNIKVGMSIKPKTSVKEIKHLLKYLDLVLVMSVEPGLGGQKYLDNATNKINQLKELKGNYLIEVDGGINNETINYVKNSDIVVVGSFITNGNYKDQIKKIRNNF